MTNFERQWDVKALELIKSKFFSLAEKAAKKDINIT